MHPWEWITRTFRATSRKDSRPPWARSASFPRVQDTRIYSFCPRADCGTTPCTYPVPRRLDSTEFHQVKRLIGPVFDSAVKNPAHAKPDTPAPFYIDTHRPLAFPEICSRLEDIPATSGNKPQSLSRGQALLPVFQQQVPGSKSRIREMSEYEDQYSMVVNTIASSLDHRQRAYSYRNRKLGYWRPTPRNFFRLSRRSRGDKGDGRDG